MQKIKLQPINKNDVNSLHNQDQEEDISDLIFYQGEEINNDRNELSNKIDDQDYQGRKKPNYPILRSQKIEIERFQDNQPLKINDLSRKKKKFNLDFQIQVQKRRKTQITKNRRRSIDNTKQNTQPLE